MRRNWHTTFCGEHVRLPERGQIGIFNRSYYEEVLIVRVHPEILQGENLPPELTKEKTIWSQRSTRSLIWNSISTGTERAS